MHPGTRIALYLYAALAIPGLSFLSVLAGGALACLIALVLRRAAWRLAWRARWLLLALLLGYGYGLPGDAILPLAPDWLPTWQGLQAGLQQAVRLVVMLCWLDLLVLRMPVADIVSGMLGLLAPLRRLGLPVQRFALRLGLTLHVLDARAAAPRRGRGLAAAQRDILVRLFAADALDDVPARLVLDHRPLRRADVLLLAGVGAVMLVVLATLGGRD